MTEFARAESSNTAALPGGAVAVCLLREAENWRSAQCELLSGIGAIWADWLKRRREAIDASARALHQMTQCRDIADLVEIQQQWLADSARRNALDLSSLACESMALPWRFAATDRVSWREQSPARSPVRARSASEPTVERVAAE